MLKTGTPYQDLGSDYFDRRNPGRTARRLVARLERLGVKVLIVPSTTVTPTVQAG
jgi:hypothetical protein